MNNMDFEDQLQDRMRRDTDDVRPNVSELVAGGLARGRRSAHRRRWAQITAAGATCAVIAGVAVVGLTRTTGPAQPQQITVASGSTGKAPAQTPTRPTGGKVDLTPQASLQTLLDLMPAGAKTSGYWGTATMNRHTGKLVKGSTDVSLTYTASGRTSIMTIRTSLGTPARTAQDRCPVLEAGTCHETLLGNGSTLWLEQSYEYSDGRGPKVWSATVLRKDGMRIRVSENNSAAEKGKGSAYDPPLTMAQLQTIVTSATWQAKVDKAYAQKAESLFTPADPGTRSKPTGATSPAHEQ